MGNLNNGALERNDSRRVALVTGGSRGIGRACAIGLAEDGFDIAVVYAGSVDAARETCEACEAAGATARAYQCDVADPAAVNACVEAVLNDFGSIWALVNNAGITRDGLLMRMGDDAFDRVLDVNLKGTFNTTRALTKSFMRQRGGCVVNMSSVVGLMGNAGQVNYAASKAGVIGLTKAVARELAPRGVRVNAVAPGFVETDMTAKLSEKVRTVTEEQIPLKRMAQPEEVAGVVRFLVNDAAAYLDPESAAAIGMLPRACAGKLHTLGNTALATWAAMCAGTCGIGPITHFDTDAFAVKVAAEVKGFDGNEYFGKRDAKHLDPCVQFAMAASDEAMHDAGFDVEGAIDRERLGVYVGSGVGGMTTLVDNVHTIAERGPRRASPYMIAMMIPNMASGNIAIRHKAKGPTLPVVTACATSAHAVGEAFRAIKHGYADAILAGGAEAAIIPDAVAGFTSCRALTANPDPATACRPFDADRDGFVMGEGACVLVLESMEHAQARGAHIYAEVVGYGNTDDAYHITSPDPEAAGIARAISLAVTEGDVRPSEGLYINAHGTSTKLNDSSETAGIKRALGEDAARAAHVSSTKSMTGHMIGATGAIEVMACAMALEQGVVPPTINYHTPDPACDLDYTPNRAVRADLTWALSTNLGFGGHNAAIALRRYARS